MTNLIHVRHMASDLVDGHAGIVRVRGGVEAWLTDIDSRVGGAPGTGNRVAIFGDAAGTVLITEAVSQQPHGADPGAIHFYAAPGIYDFVLRAGTQIRVVDRYQVGAQADSVPLPLFEFQGDETLQEPAIRPSIGMQTGLGVNQDEFCLWWYRDE